MTDSHAAWDHIRDMCQDIGAAANNGKISFTQRARMVEIFDRMTASTNAYLTQSDMAEIGKVLVELGTRSGVKARSVKHE